MARKVVSCRPSDDLVQIEALMTENQVRRLPVTNERGALVGVVSINDLAIEAKQEAGARKKPAELGQAEVADTLAGICEHRSCPVFPDTAA